MFGLFGSLLRNRRHFLRFQIGGRNGSHCSHLPLDVVDIPHVGQAGGEKVEPSIAEALLNPTAMSDPDRLQVFKDKLEPPGLREPLRHLGWGRFSSWAGPFPFVQLGPGRPPRCGEDAISQIIEPLPLTGAAAHPDRFSHLLIDGFGNPEHSGAIFAAFVHSKRGRYLDQRIHGGLPSRPRCRGKLLDQPDGREAASRL